MVLHENCGILNRRSSNIGLATRSSQRTNTTPSAAAPSPVPTTPRDVHARLNGFVTVRMASPNAPAELRAPIQSYGVLIRPLIVPIRSSLRIIAASGNERIVGIDRNQ